MNEGEPISEKQAWAWLRQCGKTATQTEFLQEYLNELRDSGREVLYQLAREYVTLTEAFDEAHGGDAIWRSNGPESQNRQVCALHAQRQWYRLRQEALNAGFTDQEWCNAVHEEQERWDRDHRKPHHE